MKEEFVTVIKWNLNERLMNRQFCVHLDDELILCDSDNINMKKMLCCASSSWLTQGMKPSVGYKHQQFCQHCKILL
jgi:hypothetical protein